jgi:hypothetical protein
LNLFYKRAFLANRKDFDAADKIREIEDIDYSGYYRKGVK